MVMKHSVIDGCIVKVVFDDGEEAEDLEVTIRVTVEPDDEPEYLTPSVCRSSCLTKQK